MPNSLSSRHFFMEVSFDGTGFSGWQSQPNGNTVQQLLEKKISGLFGNVPIKIHGSGRTDAGVHALGMGTTFSAPESPYIPDNKILGALNNLLPPCISVKNLIKVAPDFHARFSAKGKAYTYVIKKNKETPFDSRYCWFIHNFNEIKAVRQALDLLQGKHDFSAFTVKRSEIDEAIRTIYRIDLNEIDDYVCITFIGEGFLYKMVRSIIGSIAKIATGKLKPDAIQTFLDAKDRAVAEKTAPPQGLFLMKVFYKENEWQKFKLKKLPFHQ